MDNAPQAPLTTREFAARWHAIVEEHFVGKVAETLGQLATGQPDGTTLAPAQCRTMAVHVVQALHIAASPTGGVQEAVRYLAQVAGEGEAAPAADRPAEGAGTGP
jgi:hypothetical protein